MQLTTCPKELYISATIALRPAVHSIFCLQKMGLSLASELFMSFGYASLVSSRSLHFLQLLICMHSLTDHVYNSLKEKPENRF